jgi:hypothetical protein
MIGLTFDAQEIQNAPTPVRHWIEQQMLAAFGQGPKPVPQLPHLTACTETQAVEILARIRQARSAIDVFFEFARPEISYGEPPVVAFRLIDIQRRAGLDTISKLLESLDLINQTFAEVCNDPAAKFCNFDNEGHCLVLLATHRTIATLWKTIIAEHGARLQRAVVAAE